MNWTTLWITLCVICICLNGSHQCSPPQGWWPMQPEKRAQKAGIVVYGTVVNTPPRSPNSTEDARFYGVIFHVHCVIKGPKLPQYIRVEGFSNFSGGLCVHTKAFLNRPYLVFIKRDFEIPERFRVLEVNIQKGAVHPGHKLSVLREVMAFAGENASLPIGVKHEDANPGCPHFKKRKFRDPGSSKSKYNRACRCRRKRQKRKKRKRINSVSRPKQHPTRNVTVAPTLPRTRHFSEIAFDEETVSDVEVLAFRNAVSYTLSSHQINTYCLWGFVALNIFMISLLPT